MKPVSKLLFTAIIFIIFFCLRAIKKRNRKKIFSRYFLLFKARWHMLILRFIQSVKSYLHDSLKNDTIYIPREEFRKEAQDFLTIPDIVSFRSISERYTETKIMSDLNRVSLVYIPVNPEKEEIQRQEILIRPDPAEEDKITNIIINSVVNTRDSSVQKRMIWKIDKSFQVTTIRN